MRRARKPAPVYYADLRELVFHAAEAFPETRFFPSGDAAMPYVTGRELRRFGGALGAWAARRGLQGKHIAILGQNGAAWISCFFAALSGGCVAVPLHLGTKTEELISCVRRSDSTVLLFDEGNRADAEAICAALPETEIAEMHDFLAMLRAEAGQVFPPLMPNAPAALYFTSGTTAQSRCVVLTHRNMGSHASAAMSQLPLSRV